jgi:hypothetical protein
MIRAPRGRNPLAQFKELVIDEGAPDDRVWTRTAVILLVDCGNLCS